VKFQNNPQHRRMLVNERIGSWPETLRDAGLESVPLEGFAVWTAKMRPMIG
jgi:hypothetical protein